MCANFPVVELDNAIRFSTLFRMSVFLWHSSKWAGWFGHCLPYTSGIEVLACSLDTNVNYVTAMLQLRPSLNHFFGCILKDRYYATPAVISPEPETLRWSLQQNAYMFLRPLAEYLAASVFFVVIISSIVNEVIKTIWIFSRNAKLTISAS